MTPEGQLLANRAAEIVGRVESASNELAAQIGLRAGRVRLAGFQSALSTIVPEAAATLARKHPGFRYADTPVEDEGFRLVHVADDPTYLVSQSPGDSLTNYSEAAWIGGCERCRAELISVCQRSGFTPRIAFVSDDMVVMQALVAAGMGVTILPGLALQAHRSPAVHTTELPDFPRHIYAVTYGNPPDPPAATALIQTIRASI